MTPYLKSLIKAEHSKKQRDLIADEIENGKIKIEDLFLLIESDQGFYPQRGAFVITGIQNRHPEILKNQASLLFRLVQPHRHEAVARCVYRYLADSEIPEEIEGEVFEQCLKALISKKTTVAVKAHAMTICARIAVKYPELKNEIVYAIKEQLPESSRGYQSRAKKELKRLELKT